MSQRIDYYSWVPTTLEGLTGKGDAPLIFDLESDGLLDQLTKIHCIVLHNPVTGHTLSAHEPDEIMEALYQLEFAPVIVGHNIIGFDIPALQKVYPGFKPKGKVYDTLNASRLIWPELKNDDFNRLRSKKHQDFPKKFIGLHGLEAWGYRLGVYKGEFGKTTDWSEWSPEMQSYCGQDVVVTTALFRHILSRNYSQEALALEFAFQECIRKQEQHGFPFDTAKAEQLYAKLAADREIINQEFQKIFPPKKMEETIIPKASNRVYGYTKGVPFTKKWEVPFNPNSNFHVAERLKEKYGWIPSSFTPTGEPALDEETLATLPYPEAKRLTRYREINKIIAMLAEGNAGWLKLVKPDGRIYGRVTTNGCVSGRCSHSKPNLGQVPKQGELGQACRELFRATEGWVMVGADASGLELRVFGHFLARYDGGRYAHEVVQGDIHTANQKAAGLATRDDAKTFISNVGMTWGKPLD